MHPILFEVGPFRIYSYGLMVAVGFLAAMALASRFARRQGWDPAAIQRCAFVSLLAGIIGARAAYVALNWDLFRGDPWEIIRLDHGGLVFYGGLIAGVAAAIWVLRRSRLPLWQVVDGMIPPLVLGHAVGRIGCFLNGCCYGKATALPWGIAFPGEGIPRHPTQLYESGFLFLLFLTLFLIPSPLEGEGKGRGGPGTVTLLYGFLYGAWRFFVEFFRGDSPVVSGGLTVFQWASIPLVVFCGWMLLRIRFRRERALSGSTGT